MFRLHIIASHVLLEECKWHTILDFYNPYDELSNCIDF